MSNFIKENEKFIETDCKIEFQGKAFESGGSFIALNKKTGKLGGILYASPKTKEVTSWDGSLRIKAYFGRVFNTNFYNCRRQYAWFEYQGKKFIGINYSVDNQDCITVRELN